MDRPVIVTAYWASSALFKVVKIVHHNNIRSSLIGEKNRLSTKMATRIEPSIKVPREDTYMQNKRSSRALYKEIYNTLLPTFQDARACQAMTQQLLAHYFQCDRVALIMEKDIVISSQKVALLATAVQRLQQHEPIQYVLGKAPFLGRDFQVNTAVLIPRPETEEMVQCILQENERAGLRVLDIGTGSGCIAITLQQELQQATVHALEIDPKALAVAQANAQKLGASLQWLQADILQDILPDQQWDIIASNPPYVREKEQSHMHCRVLDFEPASALFVPDKQPLVFYERIATLAPRYLTPSGKLYLEINEAFGTEVAHLLTEAGFKAINISQDLNGKDRWVRGQLP